MDDGAPARARRWVRATAFILAGAGAACEMAPGAGLTPRGSRDAGALADGGAADVGGPDAADAQPPPVAASGPLDLGFGAVRRGATATRTVELVHRGAPAVYRVTAPAPCAEREPGPPFCHRATPRRVAEGEVYPFDVVYRPRAPTGPGERHRAELVVEREGDPPWRIIVDGTSPGGAPVRCFGPSGLGTVPPGACVPFVVRCGVEGPTEAALTDLRIESAAEVRRIDGAPWPSRQAPLWVGAADAPLSTWRYEVCPRDRGPFAAQIVWEVETDAEHREGRSELVSGRAEPIEVAIPASVEVPLLHGETRVEIENVGAAPIDIDRADLTGPFALGSSSWGESDPTGRVLSPGASWSAMIAYDVPAFAGAPTEGRLDVFVRGLDTPISTRLISTPTWSPACDLELPDDVDLGVITPRLVFGDPDGGLRIRTNGFVLPVRNVGGAACVLEAEVEGLLDEAWTLGRRTSLAITGRPETSPTFWVPAGGTARLGVAPSFRAAPGPATGSLSVRVPGSDAVLGSVGVTAEIAEGGAEIQVEGVGPEAGSCGNDVGFAVEVPAGPEVRSARLIGALAGGASLSSSTSLPASPPLAFDVEFRALDGGLRLELETTLGAVVVPLAVTTTDVASRRVVDQFQMLGRPGVDYLFVLDDSASMTRFRQNLAANFSDFWIFAEAQALDYRLFVAKTTRRDPGLQISAATGLPYSGPDDAASEFLAWVDVAEAEAGSGIELPLERALEAVEAARPSLRPDAVLSVVVVADERDRSPTATDVALNALRSVKGFRNTQLFSFNAIGGGEPGCVDREGRVVEANPRLVELVERTGGVSASLCTSDWSRTLEHLSRTALGYKSWFFLRDQPDPPTKENIRIEVDGVEVPPRRESGRVNWTYDFSTNAIRFTPLAVPGPGSHIRVEYDTDGCP